MSDKIKVADSIRRVAILYQHMVEAADMLETIGSLEQAKLEADKARDAAESARNSAVTEAEKVAQAVDAAKIEAASVLAEAKRDADVVMSKAQAAAVAHLEEARKLSDEIMAKASTDAAAGADAMTAQIAQMRVTLEKLQADTASALDRRDAAEADALAAQSKLDAIMLAIRKLAGNE